MKNICKDSKKCKTVVKIMVSSFLVFLLIVNVDWQEVWGYISNANLYLIVLYILFYLLGLMISARKWQILAQFKDFKQTYSFYLKTYLLGTFLNNFFPSFVGGDTYRAYALGKPVKRIEESSTTIVADRISGLVGVMILAILFALLNFEMLKDEYIIVSIILTLIVVTSSFLVVMIFFQKRFIQYFIGLLPQVIENYINKVFLFRTKDIAMKTLTYSFFFAFVGIAVSNFILFLSIGAQLSMIDFMSVIFLSSIISAAPISIGNIGVKEWAYVFLFGIFGVSASVAVTVVLLSRVLQMLVSFVAIPFYLENKKKLTEVS
ncbi:MAG: lysylphosphatidylglycerol synthase transmembrane domain-containing protein [Patescibacteria group bacterium]